MDIFYRNVDFHNVALEKKEEEVELKDTGLMVEQYGDYWAVLMDKGYQGAMEYVRAIRPKKKQPLRPLSLEDQQFNQDVSSDRTIVENYFGRLSSLWSMLSQTYRWSEESYNMIFKIGMALTNLSYYDPSPSCL